MLLLESSVGWVCSYPVVVELLIAFISGAVWERTSDTSFKQKHNIVGRN